MAFSDPEHNIKQLGLAEGMHVADLGAGSGFYTLAAARAVGHSGKVYAFDVQKDMLTHIKNTAEKAHLKNIEIIHADIEKHAGTKVKEHSMDAAIVSNVLFQMTHREGFVLEVKRIVKPGGRVLVIDWKDSGITVGPPAGHIFKYEKARELFEKQGFTFFGDISAGDHHYGFIMNAS